MPDIRLVSLSKDPEEEGKNRSDPCPMIYWAANIFHRVKTGLMMTSFASLAPSFLALATR